MTDVSLAALKSIEGAAATLRSQIFELAKDYGYYGVTCDEVEKDLQMRHQTASARIRELEIMGKLVKTEDTRPTRSGRAARIYVANNV